MASSAATTRCGGISRRPGSGGAWLGRSCRQSRRPRRRGAARAIIQALLLCGVKKITLINRTKDRALELAGRPARRSRLRTGPSPAGAKRRRSSRQHTSLGMKGQPPLEIDLGPLPAQAVVSDIVYVPLETELLRMAKARGLRGVSGLGMLLHQARRVSPAGSGSGLL